MLTNVVSSFKLEIHLIMQRHLVNGLCRKLFAVSEFVSGLDPVYK